MTTINAFIKPVSQISNEKFKTSIKSALNTVLILIENLPKSQTKQIKLKVQSISERVEDIQTGKGRLATGAVSRANIENEIMELFWSIKDEKINVIFDVLSPFFKEGLIATENFASSGFYKGDSKWVGLKNLVIKNSVDVVSQALKAKAKSQVGDKAKKSIEAVSSFIDLFGEYLSFEETVGQKEPNKGIFYQIIESLSLTDESLEKFTSSQDKINFVKEKVSEIFAEKYPSINTVQSWMEVKISAEKEVQIDKVQLDVIQSILTEGALDADGVSKDDRTVKQTIQALFEKVYSILDLQSFPENERLEIKAWLLVYFENDFIGDYQNDAGIRADVNSGKIDALKIFEKINERSIVFSKKLAGMIDDGNTRDLTTPFKIEPTTGVIKFKGQGKLQMDVLYFSEYSDKKIHTSIVTGDVTKKQEDSAVFLSYLIKTKYIGLVLEENFGKKLNANTIRGALVGNEDLRGQYLQIHTNENMVGLLKLVVSMEKKRLEEKVADREISQELKGGFIESIEMLKELNSQLMNEDEIDIEDVSFLLNGNHKINFLAGNGLANVNMPYEIQAFILNAWNLTNTSERARMFSGKDWDRIENSGSKKTVAEPTVVVSKMEMEKIIKVCSVHIDKQYEGGKKEYGIEANSYERTESIMESLIKNGEIGVEGEKLLEGIFNGTFKVEGSDKDVLFFDSFIERISAGSGKDKKDSKYVAHYKDLKKEYNKPGSDKTRIFALIMAIKFLGEDIVDITQVNQDILAEALSSVAEKIEATGKVVTSKELRAAGKKLLTGAEMVKQTNTNQRK